MMRKIAIDLRNSVNANVYNAHTFICMNTRTFYNAHVQF